MEINDGSENTTVTTLCDSCLWDLWHAAAFGAIGAYYASVPPVLNPQLNFRDLSGRQWVQMTLSNDKRCFDNFRMYPDAFNRLHWEIVNCHGLPLCFDNFDSMEALGLFLWACGTRQSQKQVSYRCGRTQGVVGKKFDEVIEALFSFAHRVIGPKDAHFSTVHDTLREYSPMSDGCIGALDCTHIPLKFNRQSRQHFLDRNNMTTQNVLAICDFDMIYTYVGVGMSGAAHDMAVLKKGWETGDFRHPPAG